MNDADPRASRADDAHGPVRVHEPVLLPECLDAMDLRAGMTLVDGTVGAGGHAAAFARALGPDGLVVGLDRDAEILPFAERALTVARAEGGARFVLRHSPYSDVEHALSDLGIASCDRVFLDLGVSSLQLDSPLRGFSFMRDGPLDMRMDASRDSRDAAAWLRGVSTVELERVLGDYGEERFAGRIARAIVEARTRRPITRTLELVELVMRAIPPSARHGRVHAATRTFQAIRIAVNDELGELERGLPALWQSLAPGGRLATISFHSLEDRVLKRFLKAHADVSVKKPMVAGRDECARNPRARSAKLRWGSRGVA